VAGREGDGDRDARRAGQGARGPAAGLLGTLTNRGGDLARSSGAGWPQLEQLIFVPSAATFGQDRGHELLVAELAARLASIRAAIAARLSFVVGGPRGRRRGPWRPTGRRAGPCPHDQAHAAGRGRDLVKVSADAGTRGCGQVAHRQADRADLAGTGRSSTCCTESATTRTWASSRSRRSARAAASTAAAVTAPRPGKRPGPGGKSAPGRTFSRAARTRPWPLRRRPACSAGRRSWPQPPGPTASSGSKPHPGPNERPGRAHGHQDHERQRQQDEPPSIPDKPINPRLTPGAAAPRCGLPSVRFSTVSWRRR